MPHRYLFEDRSTCREGFDLYSTHLLTLANAESEDDGSESGTYHRAPKVIDAVMMTLTMALIMYRSVLSVK
jgi:hypothetical protein